jgi:acyl-CoA thioester hydrolase
MTVQKSTAIFRVQLRAQWRDFDALRHVNAATYMTYLEEGRDAWLNTLLGLTTGEHYVLAAISLEFQQPLTLDDRDITVEITPVSAGRKSVRLHERLVGAQGEILVEAQTVIVMWDPFGDPPSSRALTDVERALISS